MPVSSVNHKSFELLQQLYRGAEALLLNDSAILDGLSQILTLLGEREQSGSSEIKAATRFRNRAFILDETDDLARQRPDLALLRYLRPFVDECSAVEVGAGEGHAAVFLACSGYRVYAFEPSPRRFDELQAKHQGNEDLRCFQLAVGFSDGEAISPQVRPLASLARTGEIPSSLGLLRIETAGGALDALRGMGEVEASIVAVKFCEGSDGAGQIARLVAELTQRRYEWYVVLHRRNNRRVPAYSYYYNRRDVIAESKGYALFFRRQDVFVDALRWAAEVLPPTLFR